MWGCCTTCYKLQLRKPIQVRTFQTYIRRWAYFITRAIPLSLLHVLLHKQKWVTCDRSMCLSESLRKRKVNIFTIDAGQHFSVLLSWELIREIKLELHPLKEFLIFPWCAPLYRFMFLNNQPIMTYVLSLSVLYLTSLTTSDSNFSSFLFTLL